MHLSSLFVALGACAAVACSATGSLDTTPPPGADDSGAPLEGGADDAASAADASPPPANDAAPHDDAGPGGPPGVFDSGPPVIIGGGVDSGGDEEASAPDAAPDTGPSGGCTTIAQCPYQLATEVSGVGCINGVCTITCNGENYDVNGVLSDGCEVAAICPASQGATVCPVDHHTSANAANAGSYPCDDGSSAQNMTGSVPSDNRTHVPPVDGFDTGTGAAPDYFSIDATGGLTCQDDANLNLAMVAPTAQLPCYVLNLLTDKSGSQSCQTNASGQCSISNGSGSYSDNSTITVWVSKAPSCSAAGFPDDGTFQITGHL